jgi:hypothetical protein
MTGVSTSSQQRLVSVRSKASKTQDATSVAWSKNNAKLVPRLSQVAPSGLRRAFEEAAEAAASSPDLFDDFDDPVCARVDQDRAPINDRIAVVTNAVFWRHVVVGHPVSGKVRADSHIALVGV